MNKLDVGIKLKGWVTFTVARSSGEVETYEFENLLLNNLFTSGSSLNYCTIGSGATPPNVADTQLAARIGNNLSAIGEGSVVATTWEGSVATVARKTKFVFGPGAVVGNASELAIYNGSTIQPTAIMIRSLIKDVNGDPTTITLTAGDQLTVEHTLFAAIETRPAPVVMNIKGVDYSVAVIVCAPVAYAPNTATTQTNPSSYPYINAVGGGVRLSAGVTLPPVGSVANAGFTGANAQVTATASYNRATGASGYSSDTYTATLPTSTQLTGNADIGGVTYRNSDNATPIAVTFTPPLPKNNTVGYTFALTCKLSRV